MTDTDKRQHRRGGPPARGQPPEGRDADASETAPAEMDDRPRREDEMVGRMLGAPSPENGGSRDEKGVVPGRKKPD